MTDSALDPTLAADTVLVARWPLCTVLLMDDAQYPWVILVPRRKGLREIYELSASDQRQYLQESVVLSRWLMKEFKGDKLNVAALGNVVAQLHIHHVVRYRSDPAWPAPVWGHQPRQPYDSQALARLKQRLLPLQHLL